MMYLVQEGDTGTSTGTVVLVVSKLNNITDTSERAACFSRDRRVVRPNAGQNGYYCDKFDIALIYTISG